MSPFFVLIFTCGYITCDPPKSIDFPDEASCREFVVTFGNTKGVGIGVTCFDRASGKRIISSIPEKEKKQ